jgi:hypothetical protein
MIKNSSLKINKREISNSNSCAAYMTRRCSCQLTTLCLWGSKKYNVKVNTNEYFVCITISYFECDCKKNHTKQQ